MSQRGQECKNEQGVPSGKRGAFSRYRDSLDSSKQLSSRKIVQATAHPTIDQVIDFLVVQRLRERKTDRSRLYRGNDELNSFLFFEGDDFFMII